MTHYNRKFQLFNTLYSIQNQPNSRELTEIIIVDDVSTNPLTYEELNKFDLDIKLISIQTKNKWWVNPCIGFNTAMNFINGSRTIIQNAECMHATPILEFVMSHLKYGEYIAMSTLNLSKESTLKINLNDGEEIDLKDSEWYCHSIHAPRALNFCAAIHTTDLIKSGGFDNRFANGFFYDDDSFLLNLKNIGVDIKIEDSQLAYHQWHKKIWFTDPNMGEYSNRNYNLLQEILSNKNH